MPSVGGGPSRVDVLVAGAADDQGLPSSFRHEVHPGGLLRTAGPVEIGEFADVVNLEVLPRGADLTAFGEEPVDQLVALRAGQDRPLVEGHGRALSSEREPAEAGDQWPSSPIAFHADL